MTSHQAAEAELSEALSKEQVQSRLELINTSIVPNVATWKSCRASSEELSRIHHLKKADKKKFRIPSIRKTANDGLRAYLAGRHPHLPIDDLLFAVDMELLHIHDKLGRMLFSKHGVRAELVALSAGFDEWRFWGPDTLRLDDFVLASAAAKRGEGELNITDADVVELYLAKFAEHRFEGGLLPYPAGVTPKRIEQMYRDRVQFEPRNTAPMIKAAMGKQAPCPHTEAASPLTHGIQRTRRSWRASSTSTAAPRSASRPAPSPTARSPRRARTPSSAPGTPSSSTTACTAR